MYAHTMLAGLSLGQPDQPSALCVVDRSIEISPVIIEDPKKRWVQTWDVVDVVPVKEDKPWEPAPKPRYDVRHVLRWNASDYSQIAGEAGRLLSWPTSGIFPKGGDMQGSGEIVPGAIMPDGSQRKQVERYLLIDGSCVGKPTIDAIRRHFRELNLRDNGLPKVQMKRVLVTGGERVIVEHGFWEIPKVFLVGCRNLLNDEERLLIDANLANASMLGAELKSCRVEVTRRAGEVYSQREARGDDLALSLLLAVLVRERGPQKFSFA